MKIRCFCHGYDQDNIDLFEIQMFIQTGIGLVHLHNTYTSDLLLMAYAGCREHVTDEKLDPNNPEFYFKYVKDKEKILSAMNLHFETFFGNLMGKLITHFQDFKDSRSKDAISFTEYLAAIDLLLHGLIINYDKKMIESFEFKKPKEIK